MNVVDTRLAELGITLPSPAAPVANYVPYVITGNLLVILQNCAPRAEIGLWTGIYNFIGNIAGILSPIITGVLISKSGGSYTPPFVLAAALIALGPLALWLVLGEVKPADAAE